jgi:GntR family negative regulator for fad regulon and positive regulator of fabA
LQRLARDGWLTIQQGKATLVNDFWREGGLNVLGALVQHGNHLPADFIPNLLEVRLYLAPAYTRASIEQAAGQVTNLLEEAVDLVDTPAAFAAFDWKLHHSLTVSSGNPVYTLILNGFAGFYEAMACRYFAMPQARAASRTFYASLLEAARAGDAEGAERLAREVMRDSISLWRRSRETAEA